MIQRLVLSVVIPAVAFGLGWATGYFNRPDHLDPKKVVEVVVQDTAQAELDRQFKLQMEQLRLSSQQPVIVPTEGFQ